MLRYMLDTNIAIYVIRRRPVEVLGRFNGAAGRICISVITLGELVHGVEKSSRPDHNRKQVDDFVSRLDVLDYVPQAAGHYGDIRASLEKKGLVIGINDLHIAAHARSEGLCLVTNNLREFERVPGLLLENWLQPPPG